MARLDGTPCDNHSAGVWRYKNRKVETWGAKYRIDQYPYSLGTFPTQLSAMLAYDDAVADLVPSWKFGSYVTTWGRKELERHPDLTIWQMAEHDRPLFVLDEYVEATKQGNGNTYLTEMGYSSAMQEDKRMLDEALELTPQEAYERMIEGWAKDEGISMREYVRRERRIMRGQHGVDAPPFDDWYAEYERWLGDREEELVIERSASWEELRHEGCVAASWPHPDNEVQRWAQEQRRQECTSTQ